MFKKLLYIAVIIMAVPAKGQHIIDTFRLYFDLNDPNINKNTAKKIDLLIYNDRIIYGSSITIIGYADFLGSHDHNKKLSINRAQNVKSYLVKYGNVNEEDVKVCVGKGKVSREDETDKDGYPSDRRVDIVVNNAVEKRRFYPTPSNATAKNDGHKTTANNVHIDRTQLNSNSTGKLEPPQNLKLATQAPDINTLKTLKEGETFQLRNVYFPYGSHVIKQESYATLEKLFKILVDNPHMRIRIEGHVCCVVDVPDAMDNDTNEPNLSVNRAKSIYLYLIDRGIKEERLEYKGFGKSKPVVAFERTEADAERNRRVEIRVLNN